MEEYTCYEKARILGARALQINANAPILIKLSEEELEALNYDPIRIAELEFQAGVLPITVRRPLPKKVEEELVEGKEIEIVEEEKGRPKEEEESQIEEATEEAEEAELGSESEE